jgi:hypothetical protein
MGASVAHRWGAISGYGAWFGEVLTSNQRSGLWLAYLMVLVLMTPRHLAVASPLV